MASRGAKPSHSGSRRRGAPQKKSNTGLMVGLAIAGLAVIGVIIYFLVRTPQYVFSRAQLDKYVEATEKENVLGEGASVYIDMSDGMNSAYAASPESKQVLQAVVNKLGGVNAIKFFGLADSKVTPMNKNITELYNYLMSPDSFDKQRAPIEEALKQIVAKGQPALLMTDFEEYKGSVIERAAYAKPYFIEWLAKGYNVTFYKWPFNENGMQKLMFLAVFDDNANRLNSLVSEAVYGVDQNMPTFVLGAKDFAYPAQTQYISMKQGGSYHNAEGKDAVTAVIEKGGPEDYTSYAQPLATAGGKGAFTPLNTSVGAYAEYYPLGVSWSSAVENASRLQQSGVKDPFMHLLSNLYVDFGAQSGYNISSIEARVFDMEKTMMEVDAMKGALDVKKIESVSKPEQTMMLAASMAPAQQLGAGWSQIFVDFYDKFNGQSIGTNLYRVDVVIANAEANLQGADMFFSWKDNPSLANSVKETLQAATSKPEGRVVYSYYIKSRG